MKDLQRALELSPLEGSIMTFSTAFTLGINKVIAQLSSVDQAS